MFVASLSVAFVFDLFELIVSVVDLRVGLCLLDGLRVNSVAACIIVIYYVWECFDFLFCLCCIGLLVVLLACFWFMLVNMLLLTLVAG